MTMLERIARAICAAQGDDPDMPLTVNLADRATLTWVKYLDAARAAVETIRDPTEAMIEAATFADVSWEFKETATGKTVVGPFALELSGPNKIERAKEIVADLHRAMIDFILNEDRP